MNDLFNFLHFETAPYSNLHKAPPTEPLMVLVELALASTAIKLLWIFSGMKQSYLIIFLQLQAPNCFIPLIPQNFTYEYNYFNIYLML